jgi:hypothetical protein
MAIGDLVLHCGRRYRLLGIDPMSVTDRCAELEDLETGEHVRVPVDEVETNDANSPREQRF